jgi:hypothetical protein
MRGSESMDVMIENSSSIRRMWNRNVILIAGLLSIAVLSCGRAVAAPRPDYDVKAENLSLFAHFVTWPSNAFVSGKSPLVIGVLGGGLPGHRLEDEALKIGTTIGRPISVVRSSRMEDLEDCHILFVSKSEASRVPGVLKACEGRPVLIVGETEGFAESGGVINFFIKDNRVRMEINTGEAQKKSLKISSQLLGIAKIVGKRE